MKYIDEYRDRKQVARLASLLRQLSRRHIRIMEVCGGHTLAIRKYGITRMLPPTVELLSGPGCPVCVTDRMSVDRCIRLAGTEGVILATYGDLIRVPGSASSLDEEKAKGADVRTVYSTLDALAIARANPGRKVVFAGIGFETTSPSSAIAILEAEKQGVGNFFLLSLHKLMPPAMAALIDQGARIDGYIGPGHVTAIGGADMYLPLVRKYGISIVVSGFEPVDLLMSLCMLVRMHEEGRKGIEIQYRRAVTAQGNSKAREALMKVFEPCDSNWRGLGNIPASGLALRPRYNRFDAGFHFDLSVKSLPEMKGCLCGEVLRGMKTPDQCSLFGRVCTPSNPIGACMVSSEGACQAFYRYC